VERTTYCHRALRQIVMVEGWQAVYWYDDGHHASPICALGLGYSVEHDRQSRQPILDQYMTPEEEWEIFGLEYSLTDNWNICQESSNFCGLLPPGSTLEAWEEHGSCENRHHTLHAKEA
jgi:hypothetical protein